MKITIKRLLTIALCATLGTGSVSAKLATDDAGITAIADPGGTCPGYTGIHVTLKNFGTAALTDVIIDWTVNGQAQTSYIYPGVLAANTSVTLSLGAYDLAGGTNYQIRAWTSLPNGNADTNPANDTASISNVQTLLTGTYTLGGPGAHFASLTTLSTALSKGICGPVTVEMNPSAGPYSKLTLTAIPGTSETNTVTIKGNGSRIEHTPTSASRSYIMLNGANHVTIEGFSIDIPASASWGYGIQMIKGDHNVIRNNTITIPFSKTSSSFMGIVLNGTASGTTSSGGTFRYNLVENNTIQGGYYNILIYGTTNNPSSAAGNIFRGNRMYDTYMYAFASYNTDSLQVERNDISRPFRTESLQYMYGIYTYTTTKNARIDGNRLHHFFPAGYTGSLAAYGLTASSNSAPQGEENIWMNNVICDIETNGAIYGIHNTSSSGHWYINNSISITGVQSGAALIYGAYQTTLANNISYQNNSISITRTGGTGQKRGLYFNTATTSFSSDYNNFYIPEGAVAQFTSTVYNSLADWRTGKAQDANSIAADPLYNTSSNLIPAAGSPLVQAGNTQTLVPSDLLGNTRNSPPYIGAYEVHGDYSGPVISYTPLRHILNASVPYVITGVSISDSAGVNVSAGRRPRIYYKLSTQADTYEDNTSATEGWKYTESASTGSPFTFSIDFSKLHGGIPATHSEIEYFFIAQDSLGHLATSKVILLDQPDSIHLTANDFPVTGQKDLFRISEKISGTFLVGTGQPYSSLTSEGGIFQEINNNYVDGDIRIVLKSNTTETGLYALDQWLEEGTGNYHIHIISDSTATVKTLAGNYAGGLFRLNNVSRVHIDGSIGGAGKFLKFQNNSTSNLTATIQLINSLDTASSNISIRYTTIVSGQKEPATFSAGIYAGGATIKSDGSDTGAGFENLTIAHNQVQLAQHGIYISGDAAHLNKQLHILNNQLGSDQGSLSVGYAGIRISHTTNGQIRGNLVENIRAGASSATASDYYTPKGMIIAEGVTHTRISGNIIRGVRATGIAGYGATGIELLSGANDTLDNNMISGIGDIGHNTGYSRNSIYGIRISGDADALKLYYNSVLLSGSTNSANALSAALRIDSTGTLSNLDIRNNTFSTQVHNPESPAARTYAWYSEVPAAAYTQFNHNNFYTSGAQGMMGYLSGDITSLADLRTLTLGNAASMSADPLHVSDSDLHVQGISLYGKAGSLAGITTDIDGELRNPSAPCIGADEFQPSATDIRMVGFLHPGEVLCGVVSDSITAIIHNLGSAAQSNFGITALLRGAVNDSLHFQYTGSLASNAYDTVTIGYYSSVNSSGELQIRAYASLTGDTNSGNDSIAAAALIYAIPASPVLPYTQVDVCENERISLTASSSSSIQWYDAELGGTLLSDSAQFLTPPVTAPVTYYAQASADTRQQDELGADTTGSAAYGGYYTLYTNFQLAFTVNRTSQIDSVTVYAYGGSTGNLVLRIMNGSNTGTVFTRNIQINVPAGSPQRLRLPIEHTLQPGNYRMDLTGTATTVQLYRQTGGASFPYASSNDAVVITNQLVVNYAMPDYYYYLYEWTITTERPGCGSVRVPVTVNPLPRPAGMSIASSAPFNGTAHDGSLAAPDAACIADTLTYVLTPPAGFNAADHTITWLADDLKLSTTGGALPQGSFFADGLTLRYITAGGDVDSTLILSATIRNLGTGCESPVSRYFRVHSPQSFTLGADTSLCEGEALSLSAGISGSTYLWSTGDTTSSITVTTTGTYTLQITNAAGCDDYSSIHVTFKALPEAALGADTAICAGDSIRFDAGQIAGASYQWSTGDTSSSILVRTAGSYTVRVTLNGCFREDTINLGIHALPVVQLGDDLLICSSDTITLQAGNPGAAYVWLKDGAEIATSQSLRTSDAGTYRVIVTNTFGCAAEDEITISHKPAPLAQFSYTATSLKVQFEPERQNSVFYTWQFGDGNVSSLVNPVHTYAQAGTYTVTLTVTSVTNGCQSVYRETISVSGTSTGVSAVASNEFRLSAQPNPFRAQTNIRFELPAPGIVTLEIYDLLGRKISTLAEQQYLSGEQAYTWDASAGRAGMYMIRLTVDGKTTVARILSQE